MQTPRSTFSLRKLWIAGAAAVSLLAPSVVVAEQAVQGPAPAASIGTYAPEGSGPGLWVIRDADSTLYLFGTFHALQPDTPWRTAAADAAFASADEYWFEVADLTAVGDAGSIIMQKGLSPSRPLSSLLTPDEMASLDKAARTVGLSGAQLDPMRPWFASLNLALATITQAGFKAENGGDHVLHAMAEATGKPIKGFETVPQQIGFFADLDEDSQLQVLRSSLADFEAGADQVNQMVKLWAIGDVDGLDDMIGKASRTDAPKMYETIFTARNKDWANQVEHLLQGSGTAFISVGAGHLAGPDSLQVQLEARGIRVERVVP